MIKCNKCGKEHADNTLFCTECGSKIEPQSICPSCGKSNTLNSKFCVECGTQLPIVHQSKPSAKMPKTVTLKSRDEILFICTTICAAALAIISLIVALTCDFSFRDSNSYGSKNIYDIISFQKLFEYAADFGSSSLSTRRMATANFTSQLTIDIVAIAFLVAIMAMLVVAIFRWIKFANDKSVNVSSISIKMFMTCFVGIGTLGSLTNYDIVTRQSSAYFSSSHTSFGVSIGTMFGLGICLVLALMVVVNNIAMNSKSYKLNKGIKVGCLSIAGFSVMVIMFILMSSAFTMSNTTILESGNQLTVRSSFGFLIAIFYGMESTGWNSYAVLVTVGSVLVLNLFIWCGLSVSSMFDRITSEKSLKPTLIFTLMMFASMNAYVSVAAAAAATLNGFEKGGLGSFSSIGIGLVMFSLIVLTLVIIATSLCYKSRTQQKAVENK